jgi:signal transduction histidine kinase
VANSGPLIPPGEVTRLLAPFQRLRAGRGERRDGHGLGLSIVSAIAAAHGAALRADALPGGGLAVQVLFPPLPAAVSPQQLERVLTDTLVPA